MDKASLRRQIREMKRAMTEEEIVSRSARLGELFAESEAYRNAKPFTVICPITRKSARSPC